MGSGSLGGEALAEEPTVREYIDGGASVVTFSGDKLLGGPQAGILAGERELVHRCRRHPMARALRPDKTSLAALRATLYQHALEGENPLPLHRMLGHSAESLAQPTHTRLRQTISRKQAPNEGGRGQLTLIVAVMKGSTLMTDPMRQSQRDAIAAIGDNETTDLTLHDVAPHDEST